VRKARAEVIPFSGYKHLRLPLQAPEGSRVNDAIAVALKGRACIVRGFVEWPTGSSFMWYCSGVEQRVCLCDAVVQAGHGLLA
jgi:hypothetical protein